MPHSRVNNLYPMKWLAFIGVGLLSFGCYLDYTVVNIALPTIQQELQVDLVSLQWIMNIYFLALCVLATIMGRLGDLYGRKRCFYVGVGIFGIASIIAGFAGNIHWLIMGRLLQGVGAATVFPLGPSLLPQAFPEKERGKAIAWLGSLGGIALALGPVLGGLIVTYLGWRWIFFINIPIIFLGYLFCFKSIQESEIKQSGATLDVKGMLLLALSIGGIVLSLLHSAQAGWTNLTTLLYLFVGIIAGVLLIRCERKQNNPVIDFKDFSNLLFFSGAMLCFLAGVLSAVTLFFDPLYLQLIKNHSPQSAGFILFAIPIAVFVVAFFVNSCISRIGIINTILIGLGLACLSALLQVFFSMSTSLIYILFAFVCLGSMWAMGNTVSIIAAQNAVEKEKASVATGTIVTMFNIGGSLGLAIAVIVYHFSTSYTLMKNMHQSLYALNQTQLNELQVFIANPAHSLQVSMSNLLHFVFNTLFLQGFVSVMWFLTLLSFLLFLSILRWKQKSSRHTSRHIN